MNGCQSFSARRTKFMLLVAVVALSGCGGSSSGRVQVVGTVLLDGKPLERGDIMFVDPETGAAASVGRINEGKYSLRETAGIEGILPGSYNVRIESWIEEPGQYLPNGSFSRGIPNIPRKYMNPKTSGFTAKVPDKGARFEFELSSVDSKPR